MQQKYFIGVDIGTTSTKAVVFTPSGTRASAIESIRSGAKACLAEQDPEVIFAAVI